MVNLGTDLIDLEGGANRFYHAESEQTKNVLVMKMYLQLSRS